MLFRSSSGSDGQSHAKLGRAKDSHYSFTGSLLEGTCPQMQGKCNIARYLRWLSTELVAHGITNEIERGRRLRDHLLGEAATDLRKAVQNNKALEARVNAGRATFDDYAEALIACMPVGTEGPLLRQLASFTPRPGETPSRLLNRFERLTEDILALGPALPASQLFWCGPQPTRSMAG